MTPIDGGVVYVDKQATDTSDGRSVLSSQLKALHVQVQDEIVMKKEIVKPMGGRNSCSLKVKGETHFTSK